MAEYVIVIRAESKYLNDLNEHKVTDLFIFYVDWRMSGMKVFQVFAMNLEAHINK